MGSVSRFWTDLSVAADINVTTTLLAFDDGDTGIRGASGEPVTTGPDCSGAVVGVVTASDTPTDVKTSGRETEMPVGFGDSVFDGRGAAGRFASFVSNPGAETSVAIESVALSIGSSVINPVTEASDSMNIRGKDPLLWFLVNVSLERMVTMTGAGMAPVGEVTL